MHEKIQKAFNTAAETMRLIGHDPETIVDTAFEFLAAFCVKYGVTDPVGRLRKGLERVNKRSAGERSSG